jgi:hypothetical protein
MNPFALALVYAPPGELALATAIGLLLAGLIVGVASIAIGKRR